MAADHHLRAIGVVGIEVELDVVAGGGIAPCLLDDHDLRLLPAVDGVRHPDHGVAQHRTRDRGGHPARTGDGTFRQRPAIAGGCIGGLEPLEPLLVRPVVGVSGGIG